MDSPAFLPAIPLVAISVAILTWLYFDIRRQNQWKAQKKQDIEDKRERLFQKEQAEKRAAHKRKNEDML